MREIILLGDRFYETIPFGQNRKFGLWSDELETLAQVLDANCGEDDGMWLLNNQSDIPGSLEGEITFIIPGWKHPHGLNDMACIGHNGVKWVLVWYLRQRTWGHSWRLLRRVK